MKIIDLPRYVSRESYAAAVDRMAERLCKELGLISLYQIGHVSTPGISDIDLIAVFSDGAACVVDPRANLSGEDKYLFIHNLYGVCRSDFVEGNRYSFFHNYVHLWGEDIPCSGPALSPGEVDTLKRQVALEYLLKMYMSATVEQTYRIIKLRSFLLLVKGLLYDCEFLGITSGPLFDVVTSLVRKRESWFQSKPQIDRIVAECGSLYKELGNCLMDSFLKTALYLPPMASYRIAANMKLRAGNAVGYHHSGFRMPSALSFLGRKYFNLQNRFNHFEFEAPLHSKAIPEIVQRQFDWQGRMKETNRMLYPHFMALSSSLNLQ